MWAVLFAGTTVVCALGWLKRYVSTLSLIYYMELKKYTQPNNAEMEMCTAYVVRQLFKV